VIYTTCENPFKDEAYTVLLNPQLVPRRKNFPGHVYKNQSVGVIEGKSFCLFLVKYKTHEYGGAERTVLNVKFAST
jgi:hypothetical protein